MWDQDLTGFGCKVFPSGKKSYVLSYVSGGRKRLSTVGRCSEMSLREARDRARAEFVRIRDGAPGPLERQGEAREAPTVNDALAKFFNETVPERIAAGRFTERTAREYRWHARRYVAPTLGEKQVVGVTRSDIEALAATLSDRPSQRNRVLAFVSRIFSLTERWEWRPQHTNPVRGIERGREERRQRILSRAELASLSRALSDADADHPHSVAAIRVASLSGLRISEVLAMRWSDIDFESGRVVLPETKTGSRVHDLPGVALAVVQDLPRVNPFVFTSGRTSPRAAHITYRTVRRHFLKIVVAAGLNNVRLHDLRRTIVTLAAAAGGSVHELQGLLGHRTLAAAARYVVEAGLDVRQARERAGNTVAAMMDVTTNKDGAGASD